MLRQNNPTPLLQAHYRPFNATTRQSVIVPRFGTLNLAFLHLVFFLNITITISCSSTEAPGLDSRPLYAGHHLPSKQVSDRLVPRAFIFLRF